MPGQVNRRGKNTWQVRVYAGIVGGKRKYVNAGGVVDTFAGLGGSSSLLVMAGGYAPLR